MITNDNKTLQSNNSDTQSKQTTVFDRNKNNKAVLITGTSSGIGQAIAVKLANEGYKVYAGIRKKSDKFKVEKLHRNISGVYLDITDNGSIEKAFLYLSRKVNHLDALINNAGIVIAAPVEFLSVKLIKEQFATNTFGALALAQKFLPMLSNSKIINISSMASYGIFPFISPYCASKKALDILFNSLLIENKNNIKIVSIKPSVVITPLWKKSVMLNKPYLEALPDFAKEKYQKELIYMEKMALDFHSNGITPEQVANTVFKALRSSNPKPSYNVGFQAIASDWLSKCSQSFINKAIKFVLKLRMKH